MKLPVAYLVFLLEHVDLCYRPWRVRKLFVSVWKCRYCCLLVCFKMVFKERKGRLCLLLRKNNPFLQMPIGEQTALETGVGMSMYIHLSQRRICP